MKKLLVLLFSVFIYSYSFSQKSCCSMNATSEFAALGKDKSFSAAHENPIAYVHHNALGKKVTFTATDGKQANAYEIKAKTKSNKYLFVIHEWWGLNDHIIKESDKLYTDLKDINILAVDLYDGKLAKTKEEAGKLMGEVNQERAVAIIEGALKYVGTDAKIASIGWCFGGGWSLQTALLAGKNAIACVMYYGMPEENVERLKTLNTSVLGIFAKQDQWINQEMVGKFEKNMKEAGKELKVYWFDADHAFANPSNPQYDSKATAEAYKLSLDYLRDRVK